MQYAAGRRRGPGRRHDQVGLAAEEGGDLHQLGHFGDRRGLIDLVDVRRDRHIELALDFGEHGQAVLEARSAIAGDGGAVGLVEAGLEDEGQAQIAADRLQMRPDLQGQVQVFQHV